MTGQIQVSGQTCCSYRQSVNLLLFPTLQVMTVFAQVVLERHRRQFRTLNRRNFAGVIRAIVASGNAATCQLACEAYRDNEREAARVNRLRGPDRRNQFFRSGGTTYARRYFNLFNLLYNVCMGSFCNTISKFDKKSMLCEAEN